MWARNYTGKTNTRLWPAWTCKGGVFRQRLTTLNRMERPHRLVMNLSEGPFRRLQGEWRFDPVGTGCRVSLRIQFEFDSKAREMLLSQSFQAMCNRLVQDFLSRARVIESRNG